MRRRGFFDISSLPQWQQEFFNKVTKADRVKLDRQRASIAERAEAKRPANFAQLPAWRRRDFEREMAREIQRECEPLWAEVVRAGREKLELEKAERRRLREIEAPELERQRESLVQERRAAAFARLEAWRQEVERRYEADPPPPLFAPGEEPLGWKPRMERGTPPSASDFSSPDKREVSLAPSVDVEAMSAWPLDLVWDDLSSDEEDGLESALAQFGGHPDDP